MRSRIRKILDERAAARAAAERASVRVVMHVANATDLRQHRLESGFEEEMRGGIAGYAALVVVVGGVLAAVYYGASP